MGCGGSKTSKGSHKPDMCWHFNNCTDDDYVQTKSMTEADPLETDMLTCDQCSMWIADGKKASKFFYCGSCKGANKRLHLCKACHKHNKPSVRPVEAKIERFKVRTASGEFWSKHYFQYAEQHDGFALPGMMGGAEVYNDLIRPPPTSTPEATSPASPASRVSSRRTLVSLACFPDASEDEMESISLQADPAWRATPASAWSEAEAAPPRSPKSRCLPSLGDASQDEMQPTSPLNGGDSPSLRSLAFSRAASAPTMAWLSAPASPGKKAVPPSGVWSGAVTEGQRVRAISRELVFHPDGRVGGSGRGDDAALYVDGKMRFESASVSWTEITPSTKSKFRGTVRFGDDLIVLRGSMAAAGKTVAYVELSISRAGDAAVGRAVSCRRCDL